MSKVYMEIICDDDVADELMSYISDRVDIITYDDHPDKIIKMGGEKYRGDENGIHET
jgi:hypothetical protein